MTYLMCSVSWKYVSCSLYKVNFSEKIIISSGEGRVNLQDWHHVNIFEFWHYIIGSHKQSLGQGNVFTPVCHSLHMGIGFPACITSHMARGVCHQGICIWGLGRHPQALWDTVNKWAVRILLERILAFN